MDGLGTNPLKEETPIRNTPGQQFLGGGTPTTDQSHYIPGIKKIVPRK